jgi:putative DNA primase/helicase
LNVADIIAYFPDAKHTSNGWQAKCPAHDDSVASLSIHQEGDGKVLLHCHAGCEPEIVLRAVGLKLSDLFPERERSGSYDNSRRTRKRKSAPSDSMIVAEYDYRDESGNLLYQAVRLDPKDFRLRRRVITSTSAGWAWNMDGVRKVVYRLPEVMAAIAAGKPVVVVEGEKDVHTLERLGLTATCNPGGAGKWIKGYSPPFRGADVVILPDNDPPGRDHAETVAKTMQGHAKRIRVVRLPDLPPKGDITDWVEAGGTADELAKLIDSAPDWTPAPEVDITLGIDGEPLNDLGNARRLVKKHGDSVRFCYDAGKWYNWDGRRWSKDETGEIVRKAKDIVDAMFTQALAAKKKAENEADDEALEAAKTFERHAITSGNHRRIMSMISQAESEPGVPILANELDKDPWHFNCPNGTIDLRTGELRPHNRSDLISKICPIPYDPQAKCPTWERFLQEVFQSDEELIRFVHTASGYTLTGDTREQVFFILHGCGSNGKSTFIMALRDIFGDYETKTSTDTLIEKNSNNTNDIAALRAARFVNAIETSAGKRLAEALVKELTGQDAVSARFLYQEFFTFVPVFKLWLACNHVPVIQGQDHGIWRRVRLVPFGVQFREPEEPIGPYKDKALPEKLKSEYEGILAWLVRGCLDWQNGGLPSAKAVRAATGKLQQDMDVLGGFLAECCVFQNSAEVSAKELYSSYCQWAEGNREKPLSQRWFGLRLSERGTCERIHRRTGWFWIGIRLVDESDPVTQVTDVTQDSRKFPLCAREDNASNDNSTGGPIETFQEIASQGSQESQDTDDGLDWSGGVEF